ncbi:MAG: AMP-binding protein [bacterium]
MKKSLDVENFYSYWQELVGSYQNQTALKDDYLGEEYTFSGAFEAIKTFAVGLKSLGLKKGDHISLFSENSARWMIADQAILMSGMVDAVRGTSSSYQELEYILEQSDSVALIVENLDVLNKLSIKIQDMNLKCIIHLSKEKYQGEKSRMIYSFEDVMALGQNEEFVPPTVNKDCLATLIYTSGTTGNPKGVMLSQGNLLSQIKNAYYSVNAKRLGRALCLLPIWHAYERTIEYYLLSQGITMVYTNLKNFKPDLVKYQPEYLIAVPRIWDALYEGLQKHISNLPENKKNLINFCLDKTKELKRAKRLINNDNLSNFYPNIWQKMNAAWTILSNWTIHSFADCFIYGQFRNGISRNFELGISGGGAFQKHLDEFFDAIGISVFNGYGLTESSPIIGVRTKENGVLGSIGVPFRETQIKLTDPETKQDLKNAVRGVLCVKGPQVMQGYYKNPEATAATVSPDGWLTTGDLVHIAPNGSIIITGRAKDTIVLSNGENIEPQGIEDICLRSPFIKQIVLVGQDKPSLGALIVPDYDNIAAQGIDEGKVLQVLHQEVKTLVQSRENFVSSDRISSVRVVDEGFSIENGLMTQTVKIKRNKVFEKYSDVIEEMFS